ncbi:protein kinase [Apiospora arundinis]
MWRDIARVRDKNKEHAINQPPSDPEANSWNISWDSTARELRFRNCDTDEEYVVESPSREPYQLDPTPTDRAQVNSNTDEPSPLLWREALRIALKKGYGGQVSEKKKIPLKPLEWAVEHNRLDLLHLFLEAGADANKTCRELQGPALIKAVRRENLQMVKVLTPLTGRVSCTRALGLAVDRKRTAIVEALLEARSPDGEGGQQQHVCCDFEDADRPLEDCGYIGWCPPDNVQWSGGGASPPFAGPYAALVRAVRHGNVAIVRLLLAHGADPNVGYHGANVTVPNGWYDRGEKPEGHPPYPEFSCGRPVQLAMELHGHGEIVELLLDAGADIALTQPVWPTPADMERSVPVHTCKLTPRSVYLKVTAGLEAAVAQRKEGI